MSRSESLGVLLDHAQDKIALVDEAGVITYVNGAAERILGFDRADLVGTGAFERVHPEDIDGARAAFTEVIRSDSFTERTVEYRHQTAEGSWVWLESRMSNLTDSSLEGYVVSSRDITGRVAAEQRHRLSADRLTEIASVTGDVLWMFNGDWSELLFVNPAFEDIYGLPAAELEKDPELFLEAIHPDDVPAVVDAMEQISDGTAMDIEYRVDARTEYSRWVWVQANPIIEDGEVVRIAGFSRDVTDRRRRERQLVVMDNLLRHNLRNDLNVILGQAESIEDESLETAKRTKVIQRTARKLLESAQKQREIIDLLTDRSPGLERVDLRAVAEETAREIREEYAEVSVDVSGAEDTHVRACSELPLAVLELLENVAEHSGTGRSDVQVEVRRAEGNAEFVVTDDLPPIPDIEANVLRGNHEMDAIYHSSGLGFWLVYWCVELSNGDIEVASEPGGGNSIVISLPLVE